MEHQFWHEKWEADDLGFHRDDFNPVLLRHWGDLDIPADGRVFVPLCGKSRDMAWLMELGHNVLGVELSEVAARSFFEESRLVAVRDEVGPFIRYRSDRVEIYCGDFFLLERALLSDVVAVYDRASLIALPAGVRTEYTDRMRTLLRPGVWMLLITLTYQDGQINPPPFRVYNDEVLTLYQPWCELEVLEQSETVVKGYTCPQSAFRLRVK